MMPVKCKYQSCSFYEIEIASMLILLWLAWGRVGINVCLFFPPYEKYWVYANSEYVCIATVTMVVRPARVAILRAGDFIVNIHCEQQRLFLTQGQIVFYMRHFTSKIFSMVWQPQVGPHICRDFTIALNHISLSRIPLGEWSAHRRDLLPDKRQHSRDRHTCPG